MSKKRYCCGLMFDQNAWVVCLIQKNKPKNLAGKLNGPGGLMEPGEIAVESMVREFFEETGVQTTVDDWEFFFTVETDKLVVYYFRSFNDSVFNVRTMEEERVLLCDAKNLPKNALHKLKWVIPLAVDQTYNPELSCIRVFFNDDSKKSNGQGNKKDQGGSSTMEADRRSNKGTRVGSNKVG